MLYQYYEEFFWSLGYKLSEDECRIYRRKIYDLLSALNNEDLLCIDWVTQLVSELKIDHLLAKMGDPAGEMEELEKLYQLGNYPTTVLATTFNSNKLVVTTIHSSKGRQFKYVIVTGMQLGLIPWSANWEPIQVDRFEKQAYAVCTRASRQTYLVVSLYIQDGISPFINHI